MWSSWLTLAAGLGAPDRAELPSANAAQTCQWPTVVAMRAGEAKCSGVLVAPDVVLTAAHCVAEGAPGKIRFGESFAPSARTIDVAACWRLDTDEVPPPPSRDLGVCTLVAPASDLATIPILSACEATAIEPDATAVVVGFGLEDADGTYGTKRYAFTRVQSALGEDGTFVAGDGEVGGCDGDSGGPAFVQLADGSWRVAGIISSAPACGQGPSRYVAPSVHLAWLQDTTGRDLTPCRGDDGVWTEDDGCVVDGAPGAPGRAWDQWCSGVRLEPSEVCAPEPSPPEAGTTDGGDETSTTTSEDAGGSSGHREPSQSADPSTSAQGCRVGHGVPVDAIAWTWLVVLAGLRRPCPAARGAGGPRRSRAHRARASAESCTSAPRSRG